MATVRRNPSLSNVIPNEFKNDTVAPRRELFFMEMESTPHG